MQKELQVKFLNFLNSRKKSGEAGFTLIELLVVIIIIGILAAIALPSLLGQANKAKQAEARNNVGSLVRGQQAYYLENSGFTEDIDPLGLGLLTASANYGYVMQGIGAPTTTTPITKYGDIGVYGLPGGTGAAQSLKAYVGLLNTGQAVAGGSATTLAVVCESVNPIEGPLAPFGNGTLPNQAALRGTIGGMAASAPAAGAQPDCQLHMGTYPNPPAPAWKQLGA